MAQPLRTFAMMDWGYNAPGVCLWATMLDGLLDGHLYIRHEYVFTQTIAAVAAKECQRRTVAMGIPRVAYCASDPAMFNKTGATNESIADTFARYGFPLRKGDNQRDLGWQRVRHWLADAPDGIPWLIISPSCGYLIRSILAAQSDKAKPEDVDTDGDDHPIDALRYGLMSHRPPLVTPGGQKLPPGSAGDLIAREQRAYRRLGSEPGRR